MTGALALHGFTTGRHGYFLAKARRAGVGQPGQAGAPSVPEEHGVSEDRPDQGESIDLSARLRAYESVKAVLANGHHVDRGPAAVRGVVTTVLAESGVDGLAEVAVELSLRLASAVERRAADQGLAAVDLAEVWFVD